jgi:hypothetical protein
VGATRNRLCSNVDCLDSSDFAKHLTDLAPRHYSVDMIEDHQFKRGVNRFLRRLHFLSFLFSLVVPLLLLGFSLTLLTAHFLSWAEGAEPASPLRAAQLGFLAIFNIMVFSVQLICPNTFPGVWRPISEDDAGNWRGFERWTIGELFLFATVTASLMCFIVLIKK